jgi:hypothetical protein
MSQKSLISYNGKSLCEIFRKGRNGRNFLRLSFTTFAITIIFFSSVSNSPTAYAQSPVRVTVRLEQVTGVGDPEEDPAFAERPDYYLVVSIDGSQYNNEDNGIQDTL